MNLIDPGLLDIRFVALFQAVDQRGHQASALPDRKLHRFVEQLFRFIAHGPIMPDRVCCRHHTFEAGSQLPAMAAAFVYLAQSAQQVPANFGPLASKLAFSVQCFQVRIELGKLASGRLASFRRERYYLRVPSCACLH